MPLIGIVAGRCFAGNAALLGCCDVVIATRDSSIGMGGPAMVEGGGLGVFKPEEIGPSDVQARAGVIDVLVGDEAEAVVAARRYLAFFQGRMPAKERRRPGRAAHAAAGQPPAQSTTSARSSTRSSTPARRSSCAPASAPASSRRSRASTAARSD